MVLLIFYHTGAARATPLSNLRYYEEAIKTEKVSPIFAIPLYERFLKTNPKLKYELAVTARLFDLYYEYYRYEDLILLGETGKIGKARKLRLEKFYQKTADTIGVPLSNLKEVSSLATREELESKNSILKIYNSQSNRRFLEFIFAIKLKMGDIQFVDLLLKNYPDINPLLKVIYAVKTNSKYTKSIINTYYSASATNTDKKEIFYLYGLYLVKNNKFKEGVRYFRMAESYSEKENENKILKPTNEIAKILYIKDYSEEACEILQNKKQNSQNENDEFMRIYCDPEKKENLKLILPALEILAQKETNLVIRKYIKSKGE